MKTFIITYIDGNGYECTKQVIAKDKDTAWWDFIKNRAEVNVISVRNA